MHRNQEASGPVWPTLPREHRKAPVAIVFCFLRLLFAQVYIRATTCRHALGISPRLATSHSESSPVGTRIVLLPRHDIDKLGTSVASGWDPTRATKQDPVRLGGMLASTPCGITQASSPTVMGARSSSSCESRCVAPSAGTGHPLLHRVGGRRPPSLSLVLKCEREPGTPVIPASKRRALRGDLYIEQSSAELITRLHSRVCRIATLDEVASSGSAGLGLHGLEGKGPITSTGENVHRSPSDRPGDVTRAETGLLRFIGGVRPSGC